ncbi:hypothetical protein FEV09_19350 [Pseudanabaena catenata USMAC16]|uniref:Uncharacterized protein n=1 Tax=Pseudanabaena catenata USMAC16 TaxID=1855837 RepID=A0A9X4ME15_9CYAN|nr:hypothetical protein [Pseudanabaena catenata]MDG3496700.1 hypothetical protein [Pseudanabaena catenata USMAC16]
MLTKRAKHDISQLWCVWIEWYSYIHLSQDIKPNRELRREAPQLSIGFDVCPNITDSLLTIAIKPILYLYNCKL